MIALQSAAPHSHRRVRSASKPYSAGGSWVTCQQPIGSATAPTLHASLEGLAARKWQGEAADHVGRPAEL
jgi:hypothetical protein